MNRLRQIFANLLDTFRRFFNIPHKQVIVPPQLAKYPKAVYRSKILIIDNEKGLCLLMKQYLIRKGYEPYITHNDIEGVNRAREINPDQVWVAEKLLSRNPDLWRKLRDAAPNAVITGHPNHITIIQFAPDNHGAKIE